jgi:hypothetical protein
VSDLRDTLFEIARAHYEHLAEQGALVRQVEEFRAALGQIARLAQEADRSRLDVATMLGEIARNAIAREAPHNGR